MLSEIVREKRRFGSIPFKAIPTTRFNILFFFFQLSSSASSGPADHPGSGSASGGMGNKQSASEPEDQQQQMTKGKAAAAAADEVEPDPLVEVPPPMQPISSVPLTGGGGPGDTNKVIEICLKKSVHPLLEKINPRKKRSLKIHHIFLLLLGRELIQFPPPLFLVDW